jgi:hypothetical protein
VNGVLKTTEQKQIAGREAQVFPKTACGAAIFEHVSREEKAARDYLLNVNHDTFDERRVMHSAATYQICQKLRGWFDRLEKEGKEADARISQ